MSDVFADRMFFAQELKRLEVEGPNIIPTVEYREPFQRLMMVAGQGLKHGVLVQIHIASYRAFCRCNGRGRKEWRQKHKEILGQVMKLRSQVEKYPDDLELRELLLILGAVSRALSIDPGFLTAKNAGAQVSHIVFLLESIEPEITQLLQKNEAS